MWFNRCYDIKTKYYYTLKECCEFNDEINLSVLYGIDSSTPFTDILEDVLDTTLVDTVLTSTYVNKLWREYVFPLFCNSYAIAVEDEADCYDVFTKEWLVAYTSILRLTYNKYKILIDELETAKSSLMSDIKVVSVDRFNDSPQDGGDYNNDNHTTTYRKLEVNNPDGTKMKRLAELDEGIKDYYTSWANEFHSLFIPGGIDD